MHILVVEDDEAIGEVYRLILGDEYHVRLFANAHSALNALATMKPDLIILDWLLPGMNGSEFLCKMQERGYDYPVLVATASAGCEKSIEAWDVRWIQKPFDVDELLDRVEQMLPVELMKVG